MNTVIVISWWAITAFVFFTDSDVVYMLVLVRHKGLKGAKSYIRREVSVKYDVALSHMRLVKDTPAVTFLLAERIDKEV